MKTLFFTLSMLVFILPSFSQKQIIRGKITDADTQIPLIGATVYLPDTEPMLGTITDPEGYFILQDVPVGRVNLKVSYMGYKDRYYSNILINSGKEQVLEIQLEESLTTMDEVVVRGRKNSESLNEMAVVSSRQFTIEETGRYAGSRNDISRMASNYAGVTNGDDSRNDIVVRGNSPNGLLWRLNGLTIPDPNHFSGMGSNGGPVSMLNYNVLSNSDFMTGAFPAEYGNALSGVFDIRMRPGNYEKREYMVQAGALGTELMVEGPLSKNNRSSYLFNYRFSTTSILTMLGIDFGYEGKADYQDLAFNVQLPDKKGNQLNVFGMWGKSIYKVLAEDKDEESFDISFVDNANNHYINSVGVLGASYLIRIDDNMYFKTVLGVTSQTERGTVDSVSTENEEIINYYMADNEQENLSLSSYLQYRLNARNKIRIGLSLNQLRYDVEEDMLDYSLMELSPLRTSSGNSMLTQAYIQWKYIVSDELHFIAGTYFQNLQLNNSWSLEPRMAMHWDITPRQNLRVGYGRHSQYQPLQVYFLDTDIGDKTIHTNKQLDFSKSDHFVLGYSAGLFKSVNFKSEAYYQRLFNIPVHGNEKPDSYSLLNFGNSYTVPEEDSLVNAGKGRNYGVELTLEKYFSNGYYYLFTTSLYQSEYLASDGVWRSTAFNGNYVVNLLAGKEFNLGKRQKLIFDVKVTTAGGRRYTPINEEASLAAGEVVEYSDKAFSLQHDPYFRTDVKLTYRINLDRRAHEFFINIDNLFKTENVFAYAYNFRKQDIQYVYQLGIFPTFQYKIYF